MDCAGGLYANMAVKGIVDCVRKVKEADSEFLRDRSVSEVSFG